MKNQVAHAERAHAVLSASSASRWLNCTPSARLNDGIESETSSHAKEGTLAHEISENELRYLLGEIDEYTFNSTVCKLRNTTVEFEDIRIEVDDYITSILELVGEARLYDTSPLVLIEHKVDLTDYIEEGYGTADFLMIAGKTLYIRDLKFGKGVRVSAVENSQLKLYALGALIEYSMIYDIEEIDIGISQPRLDSLSVWKTTPENLLDWAENEVRPKAEIAYQGKGELNPGDWCRFCKAKIKCKALREEALAIAEEDFSDDTDDEILLEIYKASSRIINYLETVKEHIYSTALSGKKWEGYKLVEGKSQRKISSELNVIKILEKNETPKNFYLTTKLKGIGELEKFLGKEKFQKLIGSYIVKPPGKPTLVEVSDKRAELNKADDFLD